jgi:hypothetical protein
VPIFDDNAVGENFDSAATICDMIELRLHPDRQTVRPTPGLSV